MFGQNYRQKQIYHQSPQGKIALTSLRSIKHEDTMKIGLMKVVLGFHNVGYYEVISKQPIIDGLILF